MDISGKPSASAYELRLTISSPYTGRRVDAIQMRAVPPCDVGDIGRYHEYVLRIGAFAWYRTGVDAELEVGVERVCVNDLNRAALSVHHVQFVEKEPDDRVRADRFDGELSVPWSHQLHRRRATRSGRCIDRVDK